MEEFNLATKNGAEKGNVRGIESEIKRGCPKRKGQP
jgi:hypothetical protein